MNGVEWGAIPLPNVPDWTEAQSFGQSGNCGSCNRLTTLRPDPIVGQLVCRPCWESVMFGSDDE